MLVAWTVCEAQTVTVEAKGNSLTGGSPQNTGIPVTPGQLLELSADPAATWTAGVGLPEWSSTANGVNVPFTYKGFSFPVGALVGSLDGGNTFFLVGTKLRMPVQTAGTLQLYYWDADAANNGGAIQVAVNVSMPDQARSIWGWADMHAHPFAYEGFGGGGSIFFGKAYGPRDTELPHCESTHGLGGVDDLVGMIMHRVYVGNFQWGHLTSGSPEFAGWPRWDDVTHQSMHEDWLRRAVDGGMRLMVAHAVNNEWMCATAKGVNMTAVNLAAGAALITGGPTAAAGAVLGILGTQIGATQVGFMTGNVRAECKDMPSVDRQIHEAYAMQSSIDARSGGPGQGWFRIVKNPEEAMDVMRQGKLAVILGIEVDNLFGCYVNGTCTEDTVRRELDRYFAMGVRHVFPIHFYDNGFGGSANSNFLITTRWKNPMEKRDCQALGYSYDEGKCNGKGLTDLGKFLVRELAFRGMIIDTDHLSALSFSDAMNILEPLNYPVVSGHTGFTEIAQGDKNNEGNRTPAELQRIRNVRGMAAVIPHQGDLSEVITETASFPHDCGNSSETVAQAYLYGVHHMLGQPVGIGTDFNGFAGEPGPRFGPQACSGGTAPGYQAKPRLSYPFTITTSSGSVTMDRGVVGQRVYDFNNDGLAHIGLVPDMIADWQAMGMRSTDLDPLFDSSAGYVRLWDRARDTSKRVSGIRRMKVEVSPADMVADSPQSITVSAKDIYLGDSLSSGEVWVGGQRVASLGQPFTHTVVSRRIQQKCRVVRDGNRHPTTECEEAHNEASPLAIEVRASSYANERATVGVTVP